MLTFTHTRKSFEVDRVMRGLVGKNICICQGLRKIINSLLKVCEKCQNTEVFRYAGGLLFGFGYRRSVSTPNCTALLQTLQTLQNVWKEISLVRYYDCVVTGAREPDLWRNFTQPQYLMLWARHRGENIMDIDPISFLQQFVKRLWILRSKMWNSEEKRQ